MSVTATGGNKQATSSMRLLLSLLLTLQLPLSTMAQSDQSFRVQRPSQFNGAVPSTPPMVSGSDSGAAAGNVPSDDPGPESGNNSSNNSGNNSGKNSGNNSDNSASSSSPSDVAKNADKKARKASKKAAKDAAKNASQDRLVDPSADPNNSTDSAYVPPSQRPGPRVNAPLTGGVQTYGGGPNFSAQTGSFQAGAGTFQAGAGTFQAGAGMQSGFAATGQGNSKILQGGVRRLDTGTSDNGSVPLQGQTGTVDRNNPPPLNGHAPTNVMTGGLTMLEIKRLNDHDIVLLIDKSGSMGTPDCPMPKSGNAIAKSVFSFVLTGAIAMGCTRWAWCGIETANLGRITAAGSPAGLSVVLFASFFKVFPHVPWNNIPEIFRENGPSGGTNLAAPLDAVFKDYFRRRNMGQTKPLAIGIITDGCPEDKKLIVDEIIEATRATRYPKEITITFFLIGSHDEAGERFVWDLDHNLPSWGARYDVVNAVPFMRLTQVGLPKGLADALE
jgi:hypothetical protein